MKGVMGLVGLIIALAIGMMIFRGYFTSERGAALTMGTNNPRAVADLVGVKNDLSAMAQAQRAYMALNGKYATLEELRDGGHLNVDPRGRLGYTYSCEIEGNHFVITARYSGPATGMPELSIDETMRIAQK